MRLIIIQIKTVRFNLSQINSSHLLLLQFLCVWLISLHRDVVNIKHIWCQLHRNRLNLLEIYFRCAHASLNLFENETIRVYFNLLIGEKRNKTMFVETHLYHGLILQLRARIGSRQSRVVTLSLIFICKRILPKCVLVVWRRWHFTWGCCQI